MFVKPGIEHDAVAVVQVARAVAETADAYALATYAVIGDPPDAGAVHDTTAWDVPGCALTAVGASGTVRGVAVDGADAAPVPMPLFVRTWTAYAVPLSSPAMVNGLESDPALIQAPLRRYSTLETGEPPSLPGVNATRMASLRGVRTIVGALGAALGATVVIADATLVPTALIARTAMG